MSSHCSSEERIFSSQLEIKEEGVRIWREMYWTVENREKRQSKCDSPLYTPSEPWFSLPCCSLPFWFSLLAGRDSPCIFLCEISNRFMHCLGGHRFHLLVSLLGSQSTNIRCPWFIELLQLRVKLLLLWKKKKKGGKKKAYSTCNTWS